MSGGGIRSSAVCLGVLQALNHHNLIGRIDYLSTVSGGGYIGTSLSATMTTARRFVFGERPAGENRHAAEISDTPSVGHLRNYSNYLIPAGFRDLLTGIAIVVRGLVANIGLTLPVVLLLAAVTIWSTPLRSCLTDREYFRRRVSTTALPLCELHHFGWIADRFGFSAIGAMVALALLACGGIAYLSSRAERGIGPRPSFLTYTGGHRVVAGRRVRLRARCFRSQHFALTLATAIIGVALFFGWALKQSFASPGKRQEFRSHWPTIGATFLVLLAAIAFFEFQPFMLAQMFDVADSSAIGGPVLRCRGHLDQVAGRALPRRSVSSLLLSGSSSREFLKGDSASSQWGSLVLAIIAKVALWIAGLALPLIIWVAYLYLSYWGIANDLIERCPARYERQLAQKSALRQCQIDRAARGKSRQGKIEFDASDGTLSAEITPKGRTAGRDNGLADADLAHVPAWLRFGAEARQVVARIDSSLFGQCSGLAYCTACPW